MEYFKSKPKRRKTKLVTVGKIKVGSDAPITVQSMTNTATSNLEATLKQIKEFRREAGAGIIRVSCPDKSQQKP